MYVRTYASSRELHVVEISKERKLSSFSSRQEYMSCEFIHNFSFFAQVAGRKEKDALA